MMGYQEYKNFNHINGSIQQTDYKFSTQATQTNERSQEHSWNY